MMYDRKRTGKRWNITFYDYSSNLGGVEAGPDYSEYILNNSADVKLRIS